MIQRKQSLFLLLSLICFGLFFFIPLLLITKNEETYELTILSAFDSSLNLSEMFNISVGMILFGVICSIITLFSFKKLPIQEKFCFILIAVSILPLVLINFAPILTINELYSQKVPFLSFILLIISSISAYLAKYFIRKDIELLKSLNRIR